MGLEAEATEQNRSRVWLHVALLVAVAGGLFLLGSASLPLSDPEEARCALTVGEMIRDGDWLVPHLNGEVYFKKPAPFFWLAAIVQMASGNVEFGGRAVAALAGVLAVLIAYDMGKRLFGTRAGLLAGLILATCGQFVFMARWYRMDMPFAAAMWAAIWWFWRAEERRTGLAPRLPSDPEAFGTRGGPRGPDGKPDRAGWVGFYAFCGLATLMKGPLGLALPVLVVATYLLLSGRVRRVFELLHVGGMAVYVLLACPWSVAIALREPDYVREFFFEQNLSRYTGRSLGMHHNWPGILYVPILLAGMLPWSALVPAACVRYFPGRFWRAPRRPGLLFLWLSVLLPLLFFSFSRTKLPGYILPVFAPLAVLVGAALADWLTASGRDRLLKRSLVALMVSFVVLLAGLAGLEHWLDALDGWFAVPVTVGVLSLAVMCRCLVRQRRFGLIATAVVLAVTACLYLIVHTAPAGYKQLSTRSLARRVNVHDAKKARFCFLRKQKYSFLLYANPVHVMNLRPSQPTEFAKLIRVMGEKRRVFVLVTGAEQLDRLQGACPAERFHLLGRSGEYSLVTNHAEAGAVLSGQDADVEARP